MTSFQAYAFQWNYDANAEQRETLFPLFQKVFGMKEALLKQYYASGFANPTYTPFTYFHEGAAIANVSMFEMPLLVKGREVNTAGIQSVMTDPDYRGRGLFKTLFARMLAEIDKKYEASFLFTSIPDIYLPFGFQKVDQHMFVAPYKKPKGKRNHSPLRKLDLCKQQDVDLVKERFNHFAPVSQIFVPRSYSASFYLNMLDPYWKKRLFYAEDSGIVVVYEIQGETLKLYDILCDKLPAIDEFMALFDPGLTTIEIYFQPDRLGLEACKPIQVPSNLMIRGKIDLPDYFIFPETASF